MKLIDLFNMIVNNEELPNKIKIRQDILVCNNNRIRLALQDYYYMENEENAAWKIWYYDLNDEVEIIEEDKRIEKIHHCCMESKNDEINILVDNNNTVVDKLNEIIDKINSMED